MLNYKKLDIEYKHVSEKILNYITDNNVILSSRSFWHNAGHFVNTIPELQQMFDPLNLTVTDVSILATNETTAIHVDSSNCNIREESIRINFPIINCENTITKFYHTEFKGMVTKLSNGLGFTHFHANKCKLIDSYELTQPTVIRVNVPHQVCVTDPMLLRIACTVFFKQNLEFLLEH